MNSTTMVDNANLSTSRLDCKLKAIAQVHNSARYAQLDHSSSGSRGNTQDQFMLHHTLFCLVGNDAFRRGPNIWEYAVSASSLVRVLQNALDRLLCIFEHLNYVLYPSGVRVGLFATF